MPLPAKYAWLDREPGPRILTEALKLYGTYEAEGSRNNPVIMGWARELGLNDYTDDSIPWCGLFAAIIAKRATWPPVDRPLWAANWLKFGVPVREPMLGDFLVFIRPGGNHVGVYVGEDDPASYRLIGGEEKAAYHVLGGNQKNQVNIARIAKSRLRGARRPDWRIAQPANVRRIFLAPLGAVSKNEA